MQSTQFKDLGRSSDFFLANALLIFRSFFVLKIIADVICRNHPQKMILKETIQWVEALEAFMLNVKMVPRQNRKVKDRCSLICLHLQRVC